MSTNPSDLDPALLAAGVTSPPTDAAGEWEDVAIEPPGKFGGFARNPAGLFVNASGNPQLNKLGRDWVTAAGTIEDPCVLIRQRKSDGAHALARNVGPIGARMTATGSLPRGLIKGAYGDLRNARFEFRALPGRDDMALMVRVDTSDDGSEVSG